MSLINKVIKFFLTFSITDNKQTRAVQPRGVLVLCPFVTIGDLDANPIRLTQVEGVVENVMLARWRISKRTEHTHIISIHLRDNYCTEGRRHWPAAIECTSVVHAQL